MGEDSRTPDWWDEVDKIFHQDPQWLYYKMLKRLDEVEKQVEFIGLQCTAILATLSQFDTKPATAKINMEDTNMADISVPDTNGPLSATVSFADVHGHPTEPQGLPEWSSSDESVATVDASGDDSGKAATVTILGPGATVIQVSSTDTDGTIVGAAGTITVTAGAPMTGEVSFSGAEEAPPVEPPAETPVA